MRRAEVGGECDGARGVWRAARVKGPASANSRELCATVWRCARATRSGVMRVKASGGWEIDTSADSEGSLHWSSCATKSPYLRACAFSEVCFLQSSELVFAAQLFLGAVPEARSKAKRHGRVRLGRTAQGRDKHAQLLRLHME